MVAAFGTGFAVGNALWAGGPAVENPITGVRIANESTSYPFSRTRNLIKWLAIGGFGAYAGCFFLFLAAEEVGRRGFEVGCSFLASVLTILRAAFAYLLNNLGVD